MCTFRGINKINDGIGDKFSCCLQNLLSFFVGLLIGLINGWKLTLILLTMSPLIILSGLIYSKIVSRISLKEQEISSQIGQLVEQVLSGIKTVFAYNACQYEFNLYKNQLKICRKNRIHMGFLFGLINGFDYLIVFCADALGFWFIGKWIHSNNYSIGQSLMVFFSVINAMFALTKTIPYFQSIVQAKGCAQSICKNNSSRKTDDGFQFENIEVNSRKYSI